MQSRGRGATELWTRAEWAHVGSRRGGGTVQCGDGPRPQEQRPSPRHIGRPDLRVGEREVEPGLLAEVPGQSRGVEGGGWGSTGCEATERQERGPRGKGRNGIAAEVQGSGRYRTASSRRRPPRQLQKQQGEEPQLPNWPTRGGEGGACVPVAAGGAAWT